MAPASAAPPPRRNLRPGDIVSVAARHFGEDYAKKTFGRNWASERSRFEGLVEERGERDATWRIKFDDLPEPVTLARKLLHLERAVSSAADAQPGSRQAPVARDSSDEEGDESANGNSRRQQQQRLADDSSDDSSELSAGE